MNTQRRAIQWFGALVGAVSLGLAGCGGGSAKATSGASASTSPTTGGRGQSAAFTECLKAHGVTLPQGFGANPARGSGPPGTGTLPPRGGNTGGGGTPGSIPGLTQEQQSAFEACRSKLPNGGNFGGGGGGHANSQALQPYLSCLGDHGVTVPTPTSASTPADGGSALDTVRNDPNFAAANEACQALLPAPGGSTTTTTPSG